LNMTNTDGSLKMRMLVLGEKIFEVKGKVTGVSIKSKGPEGVRVEENVAAEVKGFGRFPSGRNIGAMELVTTPDSNASGTGQVTFTSQEGDSAVWKFYVLGKIEE
jgi:hypothetical protein